MKTHEPKAAAANYAQLIALFLLGVLFILADWLSSFPPGSLYPQWDTAVHMIAGALLMITFTPYTSSTRSILLAVFSIAVAFEIAEFFTTPLSDYGSTRAYVIDTILDISAAVVGAWAVHKLFFKRSPHD